VTFTIMITTRNRCADLRQTCERLSRLNPAPLEVLIWTDGCSDATAETLRARFPQFRVFESPAPAGSVPARDQLLRAARGDVVLSLDDDSYPIEDDFLAKLRLVVNAHPEAAVITFPELRDGGRFASASKTPASRGHYESAYANCAAAMRRSIYLQLGGFPPFFSHMYEEPDYAVQCYAAGYGVWFEPTLSIRHHRSPRNRDELRARRLNARNELWSVWLRCPWPWLPLVSLFRIWRQFRHALSLGAGCVLREPLWWLDSLSGIAHCLHARRCASWPRYYAWMRLARQPILSFDQWRKTFLDPLNP
jgi:GT2 family glycosyltransferase